VRDLLEGDGAEPRARPSTSNSPSNSAAPMPARASQPSGGAATARAAPAQQMAHSPGPTLQTLHDVVALAAAKGASVLKVHLENDVHLVRLDPGQIEFRPGPRAPRTLAGDLAQKLKDWTGTRWVVTLAREGGAPSLAEQKREQHAAQIEAVAQEPMVRAVLDRFPGAEIVGVRDRVDDTPAVNESGEG